MTRAVTESQREASLESRVFFTHSARGERDSVWTDTPALRASGLDFYLGRVVV